MKVRVSGLLFVLALAPASPAPAVAPPSLSYGIDLNRRADDLFHVTLRVSGLRPENAVYQFASTAPGTYQVMNIGRYVRRFEAFDAQGRRVPAAQVSVNQWRLSEPARVRTIRYAITETWDSDIRLLELSQGERGLQDLVSELTHRYGKRRAFPDSTFVDTLVAMTHPEIRDFFDRYVWDSQPLPIEAYYARLGITLVEDEQGQPVRFEIDPNPTDEQRILREAWLGRKPLRSSNGAGGPPRRRGRGRAGARPR